MEQKRRNPIRWFKSLQLSYKIMLSVGLLIFCSNLFVLFLVIRTSSSSLQDQTYGQLQDQLSVTLSTVSVYMTDLVDEMTNMSTASYMTDFAEDGPKYKENYLQIVNDANESMGIINNASTLVDYAALIRVDEKEFLYRGEVIPDNNLWETFLENYNISDKLSETSVIQAGLLTDYYKVPMLNLYCPIFTIKGGVYKLSAVLAVGVNTRELYNYISGDESNLDVCLFFDKGIMIASANEEKIGTRTEGTENFTDIKGQFEVGDDLIAYQTSSDGIWTTECSISKALLFKDLNHIMVVIIFVILAVTLFAIILTTLLCRRFYSPMVEILDHMNLVSEGDLDAKMKLYEERDFRQISTRFNEMTSSLKDLILSIRKREEENTEIRLNALQSQIKPHFLYNALECIHWQALLNGDGKVSKMVMSLSRYYRLCLNKGQEIVTFRQEMDHVQSYVEIQNICLDDIVQLECNIPEDLMLTEIPKITFQPLVENAIIHGIKPKTDRHGRVVICAMKMGKDIIVTVSDDGIGMSEEKMEDLNANIDVLINDGSYGVKNVHQRLVLRYGAGYGLHYDANEQGGITVTMKIPAKDA